MKCDQTLIKKSPGPRPREWRDNKQHCSLSNCSSVLGMIYHPPYPPRRGPGLQEASPEGRYSSLDRSFSRFFGELYAYLHCTAYRDPFLSILARFCLDFRPFLAPFLLQNCSPIDVVFSLVFGTDLSSIS